MTARNEVHALAELAAQAASDAVRRIGQVHLAIGRRAWAATGPAGAPSHIIHDLISTGVYGTLRTSFTTGGFFAGEVLGAISDTSGWPSLSQTAGGEAAIAVLNGFAGDKLQRRGNDLAIDMTVREGERDVEVTPAGLEEAFPGATGDIVVFLHGLVESAASWRWGSERYFGEKGVSHGSRLAVELGRTPVYVRYNTGLHVSENGRTLAALLGRLVAAWPTQVERLVLVGHSMGGLVIRSACHVGVGDDHDWVKLVRHAVYLGTPHLGAPLARGAHALGALMAYMPETRPFSSLLRHTSDGICDLRHGALVDEDWSGDDREGWLGDNCTDVALLPDCRHHALTAVLTRRLDSRLGLVVGDLLVQTTSAAGQGKRGRRVDFLVEDGASLGGLHHFALLNHPAVYEQLVEWLRS